ncbi:hypothetical protein L202_02086 [Cryptococcus amylolentus CBS 6039]|uniref:Uncharacterized protein n=2 Tax=Cryptococcus amylolentus TaxID=104669 RepID=A0A1E3I1J3_9TREE|nr:hypothetical protein L202_02086 [Cryptococcus amylolentus CBS 6039]ODN81691.1 hypothetical protein L202_02086 [Cryptococcus amylolentus CBS 6039]ODO10105.1 hypothetical protein I350_02333 [Cryptococcus amylolentus CBS 6273]
MSITSRSLRVRKTGCSPETVSTFSGSDPHVASSDRTAPAYYALSPIVAVLKTTEFNAIFGYLHTFTHLISAYVACGCQLALWGQGVRFSRHLMLNERTVLVEINDDINEPRVIGDIDAFLSYISGNPEPLPRSYGDPYNPDLEAFEDAWDILRTAVMAVLDIPLDAPLQRLRQPTGKMLDQWRHKFGGVRRGEPSASRAPDIENRWAEDDHLGEANDYLYPTTDVQSSPLRQTWFRDEFQHAAWEDAWREKRERETFIGLRAAIRQEGTIFVGGGRSVFRVLLREMRESL